MTNVEKADTPDQRLGYVQHNCSVKLSLELGPKSKLLKGIEPQTHSMRFFEVRFQRRHYAIFEAQNENIRLFSTQKWRRLMGINVRLKMSIMRIRIEPEGLQLLCNRAIDQVIRAAEMEILHGTDR
jgi:hypothetical protein